MHWLCSLPTVFGFASCSKELDVTRLEACSSCDNSGVQKGTTSRSCNTCGGSGQVVSTMRTPMGAFQQVTSCPNCEGQGEESTPCSTCGGDGRVRKSKRIQLRVPPGERSCAGLPACRVLPAVVQHAELCSLQRCAACKAVQLATLWPSAVAPSISQEPQALLDQDPATCMHLRKWTDAQNGRTCCSVLKPAWSYARL